MACDGERAATPAGSYRRGLDLPCRGHAIAHGSRVHERSKAVARRAERGRRDGGGADVVTRGNDGRVWRSGTGCATCHLPEAVVSAPGFPAGGAGVDRLRATLTPASQVPRDGEGKGGGVVSASLSRPPRLAVPKPKGGVVHRKGRSRRELRQVGKWQPAGCCPGRRVRR